MNKVGGMLVWDQRVGSSNLSTPTTSRPVTRTDTPILPRPHQYSDRLRKGDWEVRPISIEAARPFIEIEHYSAGASNTATHLHGMFRKGDIFDNQCVGIAWWIPPTKSAALATHPEMWTGVLALSRLAIAPGIPKNACSFLLARSRKLIDRTAWPCLVTYADEWRGHTGTIYRADGWKYIGLTKPERTYVRAGRMIARKAGPKTRTHAEMLALGSECVGSFRKHKFVHCVLPSRSASPESTSQ